MKTKKTISKTPVLMHEIDAKGWNVAHLAFLPNNRHLVLAAHGHDSAVVEIANGKVQMMRSPTFPPERVVFSPDGGSFIFGTFKDEPLLCWDPKTASVRWTLDPGSMDAAFSPEGSMLAATRNKSVLICDAANGQILHEMAGHKSRVDGVRFSADGRRVISVGQSQVCLWDARTGTLVKTVQEKKGEIHVIEFSPDGRWFAVAGGKGIISIYDSNSGDKRHEWPGHGCHIWHLAFSADGTRLMSQSAIGKDPATRLWDLSSCREVYQAPTDALWKFTPDNKAFLLLVKGVIEVRDVSAGELLTEIKLKDGGLMVNFAISADKKWLACVLSDERVTIWKIAGLV